jgi:hypothetical protein
VQGVVADRGQKRREVAAFAACLAGAEGEAEEGERRVLVVEPPLAPMPFV